MDNKTIKIKKYIAFTLAEVLITLGIIGCIAAMTVPNLITKAYKAQTSAKVHKFYATINQAIRAATVDHDDPSGWLLANKNYNYNELVTFMQTYFYPYMKVIDYRRCRELGLQNWMATNFDGLCTTLLDGTIFAIAINNQTIGIEYYPDGNLKKPRTTHNQFTFEISNNIHNIENANKYFMHPHIFDWNGNRESLKTDPLRGCDKNKKGTLNQIYCAKLLEMNNWKFPDDYPW